MIAAGRCAAQFGDPAPRGLMVFEGQIQASRRADESVAASADHGVRSDGRPSDSLDRIASEVGAHRALLQRQRPQVG